MGSMIRCAKEFVQFIGEEMRLKKVESARRAESTPI